MKVPPKRKGNHHVNLESVDGGTLNESPSEKEGKYKDLNTLAVALLALNESPSEKEGKSSGLVFSSFLNAALNESPSEKEGKSSQLSVNPVCKTSTLNESPSEKEGK